MPNLAPAARKRTSRVALAPIRALMAAKAEEEANRKAADASPNGLPFPSNKGVAVNGRAPARTPTVPAPLAVTAPPAPPRGGRRSRVSVSPLAWQEMAPTEKMRRAQPEETKPKDPQPKVKPSSDEPGPQPDNGHAGGLARLLAAAPSSLTPSAKGAPKPLTPPAPGPAPKKSSLLWFLCAIAIGLSAGILIRHLWGL